MLCFRPPVAVIGRWCVALVAWLAIATSCDFARASDRNQTAEAAAEGTDSGHEAVAAEGHPDPLVFKKDLAIWTFLVFVLLFLVLKKFAWKPITEALDKREHFIAENIEASRRAQDEAKEMLANYERKLAGAADQVREMLDEARRDAEHTKQQIVVEAKAAAQAEHDRAIRDIRTATDVAVKELSERSTDLAIELAGKVISAKLSAEERSRLVQDSLNKFAASTPSVN